jgi:hypothetical protein
METPLPNRPKERKLKELPDCQASSILKLLPSRAKLRIDKLEPQLAVFATDVWNTELILLIPATVIDDPRRT